MQDFLYDQLTSIKGISCYKPEGAFYLFPNFSFYMKRVYDWTTIHNSLDMAVYLLYEAGIALVPGSAFGAEGFMRFSYATSMENLSEAVIRLKEALSKLN